ncbi:MAG: hypothetical protein ACK4V1_10490 [Burkholderiaceae bacterium]
MTEDIGRSDAAAEYAHSRLAATAQAAALTAAPLKHGGAWNFSFDAGRNAGEFDAFARAAPVAEAAPAALRRHTDAARLRSEATALAAVFDPSLQRLIEQDAAELFAPEHP